MEKINLTNYAIGAPETENLNQKFQSDQFGKIVQNAVTRNDIDEIALNRSRMAQINTVTEIKLDKLEITNQKKSGRCWIFAATNALRLPVAKKLNLEEIEFSQTFIHFYDKLEKANAFLSLIIENADKPDDDRLLSLFLQDPIGDGGYWPFFVNIVKKYGIVPASVFPNSESSENTDHMNRVLEEILRRAAALIRDDVTNGGDVLERKSQVLKDVQRVLNIHLGTPPTKFIFQYRDKDKKFHREGSYTPLEFASKYLPADLDEYVVLASDPREENPCYRSYENPWLTNMVEGRPHSYINVNLADLKQAAIASLRLDEPLWFSCDVMKQHHRKLGIWAADLYDYESVYGISLDWDKATQLRYRALAQTHAMCLVGVDFAEDGKTPITWRVENSWGDENGDKGYYSMDDSWFDPYVFSVVVHPRVLTGELLENIKKAQGEQPIQLQAWDNF